MSPHVKLSLVLAITLAAVFLAHAESHACLANEQTAEVLVTDDLIITRNTKLKPGVYRVRDVNRDGIIRIEGDNITLDASGVTIISRTAANPNKPEFEGYGLVMKNHTGLTVNKINIQGFKYGVRIENATNVNIQDSDISGNFKDTTTCFLSIRDGEIYGGGILFVNVDSSIVQNNRLTNQSTGLEMINSDRNNVLNNTTSSGPENNETGQNSAWGIRLQGSTYNLLRGNIADYANRQRYVCTQQCRSAGYCSDFQVPGDSAGILLVVGSHHNRVISNSFTHSGDGFFLGNERGPLASNNNYVYGNDGSYAPANAFECTYSDGNVFENNLASHSGYGFWLGYSFNTKVTRNEIDGNRFGASIEHGHDNELSHNVFVRNEQAGIQLFAEIPANPVDDYPSKNYQIHHNFLVLNAFGIINHNTDDTSVFQNRFIDNLETGVSVRARPQDGQASDRVSITHNSLECTKVTGVNLALGKAASSNRAGSTPERAVDGVVFTEASAWYPQDNGFPPSVFTGDYWQVDLGSATAIAEVLVYPYYLNTGDFPMKYHIDVSTTGQFTGEQKRVATETARPVRQYVIYDFAPVTTRYIRLTVDEAHAWTRMMEFNAAAIQGKLPGPQCVYGISNDNPSNVTGIYNWWKTTNTAEIEQQIFDHNDDATKGYVTYKPFLLEPASVPGGVAGPGFGSWSLTTALPQVSAAPFSARGQQLIFYNNRVYLFGGRNNNTAALRNVHYSSILPDGTLSNWLSATPLPKEFNDQQVVRVGSRVYLITGASGSTDVYYASIQPDGSLSAWLPTSPLAPSRQSFAAAAYGNYIYVTGGNSGGMINAVKFTTVNTNGTLAPWAETTALPEAMQEHTMAVYDGILYVLAQNGHVYYASINANGRVGAWTATRSLPQPMSSFATFENDGYLYLFSGTTTAVYYAAIMNDGALGTWMNAPALPTQREALRVGAEAGFIYAIGGRQGTTTSNTVYYSQLAVPGGCQGGEDLIANFSGPSAVTSNLTYKGLDTLTVTGVGQASGKAYSDAFYIFTDGAGNPITPQHRTEQNNWVLSINGQHAEAFTPGNQVPAYRHDHRYTFRIIAPSGRLTFGVSDFSADNTGRYVIGLCGGT